MREIVRFIDDVNAARMSLYAALLDRQTKQKLPRDWASRFFRKVVRSVHLAAAEPAEAPEPAAVSSQPA